MSPSAAGQHALVERAPAKINLYLAVTGRRPDGFHELITVMQTLALCDELQLQLRPRATDALPGAADVSLQLLAAPAGVPSGADNLVVRAAVALLERSGAAGDVGLHLTLGKAIPAGGGLGGGSSDAAATLRGLNTLLDEPCTASTLAELAATLGSDVAFFLQGGTALCTGRGEHVVPIEPPQPFDVTLRLPGFGLSTPAVYGAYADLADHTAHTGDSGHSKRSEDHSMKRSASRPTTQRVAQPTTGELCAAVAQADRSALDALFHNDLQAPACVLEPRLSALLSQSGWHLSGSGSTLFHYGHIDAHALHADASRAPALICHTRSLSCDEPRGKP